MLYIVRYRVCSSEYLGTMCLRIFSQYIGSLHLLLSILVYHVSCIYTWLAHMQLCQHVLAILAICFCVILQFGLSDFIVLHYRALYES